MSIFVESFMEGIMGDAELACYHTKFQDPYEMELLKEKLCQYFRFLLGGSRFYIGKSMPEVHKDLGITNEVFDSAAEVFASRLKACRPKPKIFREFVKRVNGIRDQICFPKNENEPNEDISPETGGSLFMNLGQEIGIRNIVDSMLE